MKKVKLFEEFVLQDLEDKYNITLDLYKHKKYLDLDRIIIPKEKRSDGLGTIIMQLIIDYANQHNLPIFLTPSTDFGATSIKRLKQFYKGLGFVKNNDKSLTKNTMVKYPD